MSWGSGSAAGADGAPGVEESAADPELAAIAALLNGHAGVLAVGSVALAVPRLVDWVGSGRWGPAKSRLEVITADRPAEPPDPAR